MKCKLCGEKVDDWKPTMPDITSVICPECWKDCDCAGLEKL